MWKRSKVTDQTAAGQAGKCRVMDAIPGSFSQGLVLQMSPPVFSLIKEMMMNKILLTAHLHAKLKLL